MPHLVRDLHGLRRALARNRPFYWSLCGEAPPLQELTGAPESTDCPSCIAVFEEHMTQAQSGLGVEGVVPSEPGPDDSPAGLEGLVIGDELAELPPVGMPSEGLVGSEPLEEIEEDDGNGTHGPLEAMTMMLSGVVGETPTIHPHWNRWLRDPQDDVDGVLRATGSRSKRDVREAVSVEDRERLIRLVQLASMAGADTLSSWLLSLVHGLSDQLLSAELALVAERKKQTRRKAAAKKK